MRTSLTVGILVAATSAYLAHRWTSAMKPPEEIRERSTLKGHAGPVLSVAIRPDGSMLASGGEDTLIKVWDLTTAQEIATLRGHSDAVFSLALSMDNKTLASGSYDKTVKLWDATAGKELATLRGHTKRVRCVAFTMDGKTLASASEDGTVRLWDVASGRERRTVQLSRLAISCVVFSSDGRTLAAGTHNRVFLCDVPTLHQRACLQEEGGFPGVWIRALALTPNGKTLATGTGNGGQPGEVKLWDIASQEPKISMTDFSLPVTSVAFTADGKNLVTASDRSIKLWDVTTGRNWASCQGHEGAVMSVALTADAKTLASGARDGMVKLWNVPSR